MGKTDTKRFPFFKVFLSLLAIVAIIVCAFAVEKTIGKSVKDVVIQKADIGSDVKYIKVKPLSTRIMAVRDSEGEIRLAFDECLSCYYNDGVKGSFSQTENGVVCSECGCETALDDMGVLSDECTPIPILKEYVLEDADTITIPKDFLEECKAALDILRSGKGNYASIYKDADFRNMEITEASDVAVPYNDDESKEEAVSVEELLDRTETITKLYNGYLNEVTINASQSDIGIYTACYKEFLVLCEEVTDTAVTDTRAIEINKKFDEIEQKLKEIGRKSSK